MDIDKTYIQNVSSETGFQRDTLEKVYRLVDLLGEINKDSELSGDLALKGGTAINFMYFGLPRLSVDLDFNFIGAVLKDDMERKRPILENKIKDILRFKDYQFEVDSTIYGSAKVAIKYVNSAGNADRIKMDINYLLRVPITPNISKGFVTPFGNIVQAINTLSTEELFAEKLLALVDRKAPRDLYDVHNLSNASIGLDLRTLRKAFIFLGCVGRRDFRDYEADDILSISDRDLKTGLYPFLRKRDKPSLKSLFESTFPFVESLIRFDKQENQFINTFFNGTPDIGLLFGHSDSASRLVSHPMFIWKQRHLKRFLASKG